MGRDAICYLDQLGTVAKNPKFSGTQDHLHAPFAVHLLKQPGMSFALGAGTRNRLEKACYG